jgi:4-hydroxybenzoate polyprenyltransferase
LLLTILVGLTSTDGHPDAGRLSLAVLAMLFSQLSIGWSNDYLDRETDALYQLSKPVPSGRVAPESLRVLAPVAGLASFAVGLLLGAVPLLLLVIGTTSGLAYNLGVKNSNLSWLPYIVGLGVLPPFVWTALDSFEDGFALLYIVATPLTVAVHLANSLPDAEADRASGRAGLATHLSNKASYRLLAATLLASPALLGLSALFVTFAGPSVMLGGLFAYGVLVASSGICYKASRPDLAFKLIAVAGLIFTGALLTAL